MLIRQDLPIYLIVAGLYDDIENLENAKHLTFFLRAEKYEWYAGGMNDETEMDNLFSCHIGISVFTDRHDLRGSGSADTVSAFESQS